MPFPVFIIDAGVYFVKYEPSDITEINFGSLTRSKSLHPLGGRWRVAPDEGHLGQNAAVLRPHQSPTVTAAPLFVTFGDISSRRGENLSRPGEAFMRKNDFHVQKIAVIAAPVFCGFFHTKKLSLSGELSV